MKSGAVREKPGLVRIEPIEGPGVCGAQYPLKVAALGDSGAFGYVDEPMRPPGAIPGGASQPRWPLAAPRKQPAYEPPPQPAYRPSAEPHYASSPSEPRYGAPGAPVSLAPPGLEPQMSAPQTIAPQEPSYRQPPAYPAANPNYSHAPASADPLPSLGPAREPRVTGSVPVEVKPTATLACPIVSALDQWVAASVQPAAQKWFGQQVVEIKQISAYSCRGMNGQVGARISEHAFGNALDIAAFVLADGRRITVKGGWRGSAEEQAFLRDVQGAACDQFTTVLAPGSNRFHYDHIHVDLMRRASGRRICNPGAVDGEVIAARVRGNPNAVASAPRESAPTRRYDPPLDARSDPFAWRGDLSRRGDPGVTGSTAARAKTGRPEDDDDWVEDEGPRPAIDWSSRKHAPN